MRCRPIPLLAVMVTLLCLFSPRDAAAASLRPSELLIYYSWPSLINGSTTIDQAATELGRYDVLVLGDLLEKSTHPDHANTVAILAHPALSQTTVFGYITLGVSSQNLSAAEIELRIDEWKATGADGLLFDEFGYEYLVTRGRQNAAVSYAHSKGMRVIANAWVPADAFDPGVNAQWNPSGLPTVLNASDAFLFESFQVQEGEYVPEAFWRSKTAALEVYRKAIGFSIFGVTTTLPTTAFTQQAFDYTWYSALLANYEAVGWGEYLFAALTAQAPYRTPPAIDPGTQYLGDVLEQSPLYRRFSNLGEVRVNAATHVGGFLPGTAAVEAPMRERGLLAWPNPASGPVSFRATAIDRPARLLVHDASGRVIDRLVTDEDGLARWTPASAGVYLVSDPAGHSCRLVALPSHDRVRTTR